MSTTKNRSHSKIEQLPQYLRKEIENKLLNGVTYKQISEHLKTLGHDISHQSVHRFGKPFLNRFESVRMSKEFAQLLAEDNAERPTTELHEANNALISQLIMELLVNERSTVEEKIKTYKAIADLQHAQVQNERVKQMGRRDAGTVKVAMQQLKTKFFEEIKDNYPDIAEKLNQIADEIVEQQNN